MRTVGWVTDREIRAGLQASGAAPAEVECFARAVRRNQLERVTQKLDRGSVP
jgi:hypothetical protein